MSALPSFLRATTVLPMLPYNVCRSAVDTRKARTAQQGPDALLFGRFSSPWKISVVRVVARAGRHASRKTNAARRPPIATRAARRKPAERAKSTSAESASRTANREPLTEGEVAPEDEAMSELPSFLRAPTVLLLLAEYLRRAGGRTRKTARVTALAFRHCVAMRPQRCVPLRSCPSLWTVAVPAKARCNGDVFHPRAASDGWRRSSL